MSDTHLTPQQVEQFHQDGYLILPAVFRQDEILHMQQESDRLIELLINSSIATKRSSTRIDVVKGGNGVPVVRKVQPINDLSEYLAQVGNDARLLDPMRDLMQDEPILIEERINPKQTLQTLIPGFALSTRVSDAFPIHNDWAYYKEQQYPQEVISSAISLDECTSHNGPLRVWPGSHKAHLEHDRIENFGLQVPPNLIDHNGGEDVMSPAGSVMFFHSLLVHNSRPNETNKPRRLLIYSHYPSRYNMGHDVRNGPTREQERPFEQQYLQMVKSGAYTDQFKLSSAPGMDDARK
jgi:phytanoyl-CoA hydroxylase